MLSIPATVISISHVTGAEASVRRIVAIALSERIPEAKIENSFTRSGSIGMIAWHTLQ